jgi:hypothetical protein
MPKEPARRTGGPDHKHGLTKDWSARSRVRPMLYRLGFEENTPVASKQNAIHG